MSANLTEKGDLEVQKGKELGREFLMFHGKGEPSAPRTHELGHYRREGYENTDKSIGYWNFKSPTISGNQRFPSPLKKVMLQ